ncbi:type II toxin-antitoxin system VapC family toxin [Mycobacterium sp. SMC-17]|uniref:type II toxin-antitoxin system VapC family toxin n=1 Tax=Mycobacterium sp. SMC-17 TaxID=3381628 RepID=UPI0038775F88
MAKRKGESPPLIYVDTCVYLDLLTQEPLPHPRTSDPRWKAAKELLDAVNDGRVTLGTSALVDAEVGRFAAQRDDGETFLKKVRGWFDARDCKYTDVDRVLARDAARLAKEWRDYAEARKKMKGADAMHLAAAIRLGCDYLMTGDGGFPVGQTVEGVKVSYTEVVWQQTIFELAEFDHS